jgi:hypothetical protein
MRNDQAPELDVSKPGISGPNDIEVLRFTIENIVSIIETDTVPKDNGISIRDETGLIVG